MTGPNSNYREGQSIPIVQRKPRIHYPGGMAYINITNDQQRLVGPLGLKKVEQELIKRRYK
jgi:ATP-dependent helicase/DNAse subunit B